MKRTAIHPTLRTLCLIFAISLGSIQTIRAQHEEGEARFQPRVGITLSTLGGDDDAKQKVNVAFGVEAEYFVHQNLSLSVGAIYSQQGFRDMVRAGTA